MLHARLSKIKSIFFEQTALVLHQRFQQGGDRRFYVLHHQFDDDTDKGMAGGLLELGQGEQTV